MVKNINNFFIAIGFLLPQFLGLAIELLQLLQLEPHTTNTSFITSLIGELDLKSTQKMPELKQNVGSADYDLMLKREAWNRNVEPWNWNICW